METFGGPKFAVVGSTVKKKRSSVSRRPHPDSQAFQQKFYLLPSFAQPSSSGRHNEYKNFGDTIIASDKLGTENKLKRLKLKVGGVTRTIHGKSSNDFIGDSSITKISHSSDGHKPLQKFLPQDDLDSNRVYPSDKGNNLKVKWKDFSNTGSSFGEEYNSRGRTFEGSLSVIYEPVRKSKRVPKRRVLDLGVDDNDNDEEIQYLGRLSASRISEDYEDEESRQLADGMYGDDVEYYGSPRSVKDGRKRSRLEKVYKDKDYVEEDKDKSLDDELEYKAKKSKRETLDLFVEGRNVSIPTTRNRALQSGKDVFGSDVGLTDLPNGASSKRKKEKLSEVEQQLKRSEAAQRRKMQSERAAREAEAEAIRKILGQDSGRKKKEEKMKRQRDELAQERAASTISLASNTVRWVIGPTGTIVTFSEDIGLPSIFDPVPCSYPPPREKCAAPNCTNSYKYRDSKSKLPLCSLHCYRAIHQKMQPLIAC